MQKGKKVVSIGAQNGSNEVKLSLFIDGLSWIIEDIDSTCLNAMEFKKVYDYYEAISGKKINSSFLLVLGTETKTNLLQNNYDRALLTNVYHELTKKATMLSDIYHIKAK